MMDIERDPQPRPSDDPPPARPVGAGLDRLFLYDRGQVGWSHVADFHGGARRRHGHELMMWSWFAFAIDGLVLISGSAVFVLAFALIVRGPVGELFQFSHQIGVTKLFARSFIVGAWLYLVTTRVFFGFSLGEWACDLRLGEPSERMRRDYPFRVMGRATILLLTGLVTIPTLSLLSGRDWAGRLSGLKLISLR